MRKLVIKLLKLFNLGTIKIKHHYTKKPFYLDAFLHKGYWYHGKNREKNTVSIFNEIIPGCTFVIEIGAHIGYFSQLFSSLLVDDYELLIFEPGINNLPYLKKNVNNITNITLIEKAVSDKNGIANFYIENLSGQNNSLLSNYKGFDSTAKNSGVVVNKEVVKVNVVTLDHFIAENYSKAKIDFIKIDIEGAELLALNGMVNILKTHTPHLMVEVTEDVSEVFKLLHEMGYVIFNPKKNKITNASDIVDNIFCVHKSKSKILAQIGISF